LKFKIYKKASKIKRINKSAFKNKKHKLSKILFVIKKHIIIVIIWEKLYFVKLQVFLLICLKIPSEDGRCGVPIPSPYVIDSRILNLVRRHFTFGFSMVFHNNLGWQL